MSKCHPDVEEAIRARSQHGGVIFASLCRIIPERFQRISDIFVSPDDCLSWRLIKLQKVARKSKIIASVLFKNPSLSRLNYLPTNSAVS